MPTIDQSEAITSLTPKQEVTVYQPSQAWSDSFAVKVAVQDFRQAEAYRTANADWRWRVADELYQGYVAQKYWEGTKIPRASIPVYVAFEQVESMLPKIIGETFNDNPWFQADPDLSSGTTAEQARDWQHHLEAQLTEGRFEETARRVVKSGLIYGNGILKQGWDLRQEDRLEWIARMQPKMEALEMMGAQRFSGWERVLDKKLMTTIINQPTFEYVSLKDFYIDPNCSSPLVTDGRHASERKLMTVDAMDSLRGLKEFNIPDRGKLLEWAKHRPSTQGDNTKAMGEIFRFGGWSPQIDQTIDPGGLRIEVIAYTTRDRVVWVANREHPILNRPNTSGFIPYYDFFYADVPDRFYAMGICDIVEGEQRTQQSIIAARLDELSLSIHRPVVKSRGLSTPQYQLRIRPGQVIEADKPKEDYVMLQTENITQGAYLEVQASELRVQQLTGQSDLYSSGTQGQGGNSASRTATGIGAQVQASGARIKYLVTILSTAVLEPFLNDLVRNNHLYPPIGTKQAEVIALSNIKLSIRAAAKMTARQALMQTLPLMLQTFANPGLIAELAKQGVTLNWLEWLTMVAEMSGYQKRADLIRKLTPEEMQQLNQPPAAETMKLEAQKMRIEGQSKTQLERLKGELASSQVQMEQQHDFEREKLAADVKIKQEEIQTTRQIASAKLESDKQIAREKLQSDASVKREQVAAQGQTADNKIMLDLALGMIDTMKQEKEAKKEDGVARKAQDSETRKVMTEVMAGIKEMLESQTMEAVVERDSAGNIAKIRKVRKGK